MGDLFLTDEMLKSLLSCHWSDSPKFKEYVEELERKTAADSDNGFLTVDIKITGTVKGNIEVNH